MKANFWWAVPVAAMTGAVLWGAQIWQASVKGVFAAGSVVATTTQSGPPVG
jgi:hypothetical protein